MADLTHFDAEGRAHMVDVGGKPISKVTVKPHLPLLTRPPQPQLTQ